MEHGKRLRKLLGINETQIKQAEKNLENLREQQKGIRADIAEFEARPKKK